MITSTSNQQVKNVAALQKKAKERRKQGCFAAEGLRMVLETPAELLEHVYVSESFLKEHGNDGAYLEFSDMARKNHIAVDEVSDPVMKSMSDTVTPQGLLAIIKMPEYSLQQVLGNGNKTPHLLILEDIQDPGNMGTMFRTGEGAGVTGIIMTKNTVDVFSPKTIRSTMGAIFRVPFVITDDLPETIRQVKEAGVSLYAAHLKGICDYDEADYTKGCGFLIGNEGNGLTDETADSADVKIKIPMGGKLESLNAAMAAGILMYECARQRRRA